MATVLVTGANRGIGYELAKQLKERGDTVIATCRKSNEELNALGVQVEEGVDVGDDASVKALAERLGDTKLDLLINNAGVLTPDGLETPDIDGIRRQIEINAIGPVRVTSAMLPRLGAGSKVAHITSRMGSIADNTSGGMYGYRMSKAALNMAGTSMARDLEKKEIAVAILHPGMVATDMTARFGHNDNFQQADDTAAMLIERIDGLDMSNTGTFWHAKGEVLPW
jgi:NAD(P)-dependent dehydrogenase (short-subunit alcohol dehydrogenase family)